MTVVPKIFFFGIGCAKSKALKVNLLHAIELFNNEYSLHEIHEVDKMIDLGLEKTPALVINNTRLCEGDVMESGEILQFLNTFKDKDMNNYKEIIVPTDFSDTANNALDFAMHFAEAYQSNVRLVHFFHVPIHLDDPSHGLSSIAMEEYRETAAISMEKLLGETRAKYPKVGLSSTVDIGLVVDELVSLANSGEADIVFMGTDGANSVGDKLFGSNSSEVSRKSKIPVFLVPRNVQWVQPTDILYASDYQSADMDMIGHALNVAKQFDAKLHFVHVVSEISQTSSEKIFEFEEAFAKEVPTRNFSISSLVAESIEEGLYKYVDRHSIQLMITVTKQKSFWERLMKHSVSSTLAKDAKLPLIIFHK